MAASDAEFVKWREEIISQERGSRVVHYHLEDSLGQSYLTCIGTERSLRHMFYVVAEEFCQVFGSKSPGLSGLRWRSRREVVEWLTSFLPNPRIVARDYSTYGHDCPESYQHRLNTHISDIAWSGIPWSCGKQLRHYRAFFRNGTTIVAHSFVLILSEEENHYLAYLEDMYEDKKGLKKVKVRWFHQNRELGCPIPRPSPHPNEVFITPNSQVISAECVDDLATVLSPDHYEKCLAKFPNASSSGIRFCCRQYIKTKFKPFDVSTLRGYFDQPILSCLDISSVPGVEQKEFTHETAIRCGGPKRIRCVKGNHRVMTDVCGDEMPGSATPKIVLRSTDQNLRHALHDKYQLRKFIEQCRPLTMPFIVNKGIELLCQDSGIRGCWFRCTALQLSEKRLKVRYDDVENEDGCGNLEEWITVARPSAPDKLGMRCSGRLKIRPFPPHKNLSDDAFQIGTAVDAWWNDGWWEGVITGVDIPGRDIAQVYFPGEDLFLTCQRKNLRVSRDWVDNRWVDIKSKPDILQTISQITLRARPTAFTKEAESGSSPMSDEKVVAAIEANSTKEDKQSRQAVSSSNDVADGIIENNKQSNLKRQFEDAAEDIHDEKYEDGDDN